MGNAVVEAWSDPIRDGRGDGEGNPTCPDLAATVLRGPLTPVGRGDPA